MATRTKSKTKTTQTRPPVVAVLGHVDHGKTTLLDALRQTNLVGQESGGITQHIGAYQIKHQQRLITFIDTPGHAAFAKMRSRGGQVADLVLLVVAADDGVKPQTKESLQHIKQAQVPFIVVVTKVDLTNASVSKIKEQLAQEGVLVEGYGGQTVLVEVSAKAKTGLTDLLEMIFLVYDLDPAVFKPEADLEAVVIESSLDRQRGPIATILVKQGQVKLGDQLISPTTQAKVKALVNDQGKVIKQLLPGQGAEVLGFKSVPEVGEQIKPSGSKSFTQLVKAQTETAQIKTTEEQDQLKLRLILKADTAGTLEAIKESLTRDEIEIIETSVGFVTESDVLLAQTTQSQIIGFNTQIPNSVKKLAETEKIKIEIFKIIYDLLDAVEKKVTNLLDPLSQETVLGKLEILAEFKIKKQRIAGCKVIEGQVSQGNWLKLQRGEEILTEAKLASLKQAKTEIKSASQGEECGLVLKPELDWQLGDYLIAFQR